MRSLFFKIFLWFWLANILVAAAQLVAIWAGVGTQPPRAQTAASGLLTVYGRGAVAVLEREGPEALRAYTGKGEGSTAYPLFLFDEQGEEKTGAPTPPGAKELAMQTLKEDSPTRKAPPSSSLLAVRLTGSKGRPYVAVGHPLSGPTEKVVGAPRLLITQLIVVVISTGIVCYGLSHYLTAPLRRLRTASQQIARGDLSVRAGTRVGNRHDEIGQLGRDFDFMVERVETLLSTQQRLLQDMSHELRSPLTRLNLALDLAVQQSGPEAKDSLDRIGRESQRLNDLIGGLLTLARLEAGEKLDAKATIDLPALIREIVADADFEAKGSGRGVRFSNGDVCTVEGTPDVLRSAIENVIRNGIRYTPEGTQVDVVLLLRQGEDSLQAVIRVKDCGPGVPESSLKDIFRPFYRVDDVRDRRSGGVGLGLAIAQQAMRLHGGTISAANAPGGGLVVELMLPAEKSADDHS